MAPSCTAGSTTPSSPGIGARRCTKYHAASHRRLRVQRTAGQRLVSTVVCTIQTWSARLK
ncbi:hypothetical protein IG631_06495 [Alternaria alternata]|nr:hypothetical protein IG631_06495 [Alternaria alternata]